jgi:hypothetical protein
MPQIWHRTHYYYYCFFFFFCFFEISQDSLFNQQLFEGGAYRVMEAILSALLKPPA